MEFRDKKLQDENDFSPSDQVTELHSMTWLRMMQCDISIHTQLLAIVSTACPRKIWPLDIFEHNSLENKYFTLSFGWDIDDQYRCDQTSIGVIRPV